MKNLILVSKCLGLNEKSSPQYWRFHFRGAYLGYELKAIYLRNTGDELFMKNTEYLLYVEVEGIQDKILFGKVLKLRKLEDCWDRS